MTGYLKRLVSSLGAYQVADVVSKFMAVLPASKSFALENSSPAPATNRCSLSAPVWKSPPPYTSAMKSCCHWNMVFHAGSLSTTELVPSSEYHFAPNRLPRFGVR